MNDVKIAPERFIHVPVFRPFGKFFGVFRRLNPGTAVVLVVTNHLTIILPLPAGEGRGEGEPFGRQGASDSWGERYYLKARASFRKWHCHRASDLRPIIAK